MTTPVAEPDLDDLLDIARTIRWGKTAATYHRMLEVLVVEQLNDDQRIEMLVRALTRLVGGPSACRFG